MPSRGRRPTARRACAEPADTKPADAAGGTFQVEVNYVDVDAVVTDEKGNFINDLKREEFEVFEDGKPQKVEMFSFVEIPVVKGDRFRMLDRPVTVDTQTNREPFTGRLYVIVLDDQDVSAMRTAIVKKAARQFVEQYMGANDVAAVLYTSGRSDAAQEFTNNKQLVIAAIDKFVGRRMRSLTLERLDQYYMSSCPRAGGEERTPRNRLNGPRWTRAHGDFRGDGARVRAVGVLNTEYTAEFLDRCAGAGKPCSFSARGSTIPLPTCSERTAPPTSSTPHAMPSRWPHDRTSTSTRSIRAGSSA